MRKIKSYKRNWPHFNLTKKEQIWVSRLRIGQTSLTILDRGSLEVYSRCNVPVDVNHIFLGYRNYDITHDRHYYDNIRQTKQWCHQALNQVPTCHQTVWKNMKALTFDYFLFHFWNYFYSYIYIIIFLHRFNTIYYFFLFFIMFFFLIYNVHVRENC